jgi:hypothetical protein
MLLLDLLLHWPSKLRLLYDKKRVVVVRVYCDRGCFADLWDVGYLRKWRRLGVQMARMIFASKGSAINAQSRGKFSVDASPRARITCPTVGHRPQQAIIIG